MPSAQLFDIDADLLTYVPPDDRRIAARASQVTVERVAAGSWNPASLGTPAWGFLIADGMMAREVVVAGTTAAELLGAGDVLIPRASSDDELVPSDASCTVLETLRVAILDDRYSMIARRWPQVTAGLLARAERRADRIAATQAISHLTRVDTRVLTMMWLLADRWGRVTPTAIVLPLRLTHRTLARLVGARRPSVTTALTELARRGLVSRREDGSWALHGPPPEELERVGLSAQISPTPAPPPRHAPSHPAAPGPIAAPNIQRIAQQVRRLASTYEEQQRRALMAGARSRETRERSRALRDEIREHRERISASLPKDAPPSA
jgi:CRP-like cAMP-binding protein